MRVSREETQLVAGSRTVQGCSRAKSRDTTQEVPPGRKGRLAHPAVGVGSVGSSECDPSVRDVGDASPRSRDALWLETSLFQRRGFQKLPMKPTGLWTRGSLMSESENQSQTNIESGQPRFRLRDLEQLVAPLWAAVCVYSPVSALLNQTQENRESSLIPCLRMGREGWGISGSSTVLCLTYARPWVQRKEQRSRKGLGDLKPGNESVTCQDYWEEYTCSPGFGPPQPGAGGYSLILLRR